MYADIKEVKCYCCWCFHLNGLPVHHKHSFCQIINDQSHNKYMRWGEYMDSIQWPYTIMWKTNSYIELYLKKSNKSPWASRKQRRGKNSFWQKKPPTVTGSGRAGICLEQLGWVESGERKGTSNRFIFL